jgi:arginine repressor
MSLQGTIKRYSLIIDYTRRYSCSSFKEINEMLQDEGFQISSITLQRDLEDIRDNGVCHSFITNYELLQRILIYSDAVKVVSPEWLKG